MPAKRIAMRNIREVLRLRLDSRLTIRQISASTRTSVGAIQKLLKQAESQGLSWPLPAEMDDARLAAMFYPGTDTNSTGRFQLPDWPAVHQQLKRKGMTKQLLWEEYTVEHPTRCYSYSQYCDRYARWRRLQKRSMRQLHKAGEKAFIDYAGPTVNYIDPRTGECKEAQIFVAVLGASSFTFAEASASQSLPDWLQSHVNMFEFFGGVVEMLVPDNLRSGVSKACRYDPTTNPSYQQLASHYAVAVMPARPYKPRDKAKAEVGVQLVERWIMMRLRHHTFFSIAEINQCISALLQELNTRPFKQLPGNRQEAFERLDRPALRALPSQRYRYVDIRTVKVNIDYHVQYQQHHYSVPHQYVGEKLELHAGNEVVQIYFETRLVGSHPRKHHAGMTTDAAHMPEAHRQHHKWTPARLKQWANSIGPDTGNWIGYQLDSKEHPEQAYRICLGLLSLSREYPSVRLNAACRIASREGLVRLKQIKSILKTNRDQLPEEQLDLIVDLPQEHENIRGPRNFH